MVIQVADLRRHVDRVMTELEAAGPEIRVTEDGFWSIPTEDLYAIYDIPRKFATNHLSEYWANLDRYQGPGATPYALVWLAAILRYIGEDGLD